MMKENPHTVLDGGWGWLVLLGSFLAQLLLAGSSLTIGLYMVEWQDYFSVGAAAVSVVATEITFVPHVMGIFAGALCKRVGCRPMLIVGGAVVSVVTFLASFATELWHLYVFGVILGIGTGIAYMPTVVVIGFYFKKRLGFANGITYAGIGAGLLVMAPLIERLCSTYGWQGALMVHAALNANLVICGALYRLSPLERRMLMEYSRMHKESSTHPNELESVDNKKNNSLCQKMLHKIDNLFAFSVLFKNPLFVVFMAVCIATFCGHIVTLVFIGPKLVQDLGFSKMIASLAISVFGIGSLVSRVLNGFVLDHKLMSVTNLYLVSVVLCGINPLFNPLVSSLAGQFVLVAIFGIGSGLMNAMTAIMCRHYVTLDKVSNALGLVITVAGLGVLLGTQLTGKLADATGSYDIPFYIVGAGMWAAALVMGIVTKFSCWRENHDVEKSTRETDLENDDDGGIVELSYNTPNDYFETRNNPIRTDGKTVQPAYRLVSAEDVIDEHV